MGRVIADRYELQSEIGRGGMGVVHQALDRSLNRTVALKELAPVLAEDELFRIRFAREARALARMRHPNIVAIHDIGEQDGRPWFVMDLCSGGSLEDLLDDGPLDAKRIRAVAADVADALESIHGAGLVHRDVKPANILRDGSRWVLSDFGVVHEDSGGATLTQTGFVVGTPEYWAPEYIGDSPASRPSDLYSLGCVLYRAFVGHPPFQAENSLKVALMHVTDSVPPLPAEVGTADPELSALIAELLAKDPESRPTAADVLRRLGRPPQAATLLYDPRQVPEHPHTAPSTAIPSAPAAATVLSSEVDPTNVVRRPRRWSRRMIVVALGSVGVAAAIVAVTIVLWPSEEVTPEPEVAAAAPSEATRAPREVTEVLEPPRFQRRRITLAKLGQVGGDAMHGQRCFGPGGRASLTIGGRTVTTNIFQCGQRSEDDPEASGSYTFAGLPRGARLIGFRAEVGVDQGSARSQRTSAAEFVVLFGDMELCRATVADGRSSICSASGLDLPSDEGRLRIVQAVYPNTHERGQGIWAGVVDGSVEIRQQVN